MSFMMTKEEYRKQANNLIQSYWEAYLKADDKVAHLNNLIGVKNDLKSKIDFNVKQVELNLKKLKDNIDFYSNIIFKKQLAQGQKSSDLNNIKKLANKVSSNLDSYYRFSVNFGLRQKEISKQEMIENAKTILSKNDIKTLKKTLYRLDSIASGTLRKNMLQEFISQIEQAGFPDQSTLSQSSFLQNNTNEIQPIHWLNGEESLRQFIDSLKSAGLIENRETDEIIQEHFKKTDQTPQPILWSKSNRLLIYLFNKLSEDRLVDTMDRQFKLITEHFLDKKGQPFKRDSIKQDSQNMKYSSDPRGAKTIDSIIQELTKPLQ